MADQPITGLPTKTASGVAATDKMLGIDSAEGYQILVRDVAKYIIENCDVSTLAGAVRTPKAAIDLLNSNTYNLKTATNIPSNADLDTYLTPGTYSIATNTIAQSLQHCPTYYCGILTVEYSPRNDTYYVIQMYYEYHTKDTYVRQRAGTTWHDWVKQPTRAEIEALNNNMADTRQRTLMGDSTALTGVDYNTLESGWHFIGTGSTNGPGLDWLLVHSFNNQGGGKCQQAYTLTGRIFNRANNGTTWSSWLEIADKASVDALNSKTLTVTATADANGYLDTGLKYNQAVPLCVYNVTIGGSAAYPFLYEFLMRGGSPAENISVRLRRWNGEVHTGEITFSIKYI